MKPEILPEERVSRRRLTPLRRLAYTLLTPLALLLIRAWWRSCRIVRVTGAHHLDAALAAAPSLLPCYWHQHELFCARYLLLQVPKGLKLGFLVSPSVDGEVPAAIARRLGAQVIRGSSTRTGAKALRDYYQLLVNENVSPVITPDGPTGPPHRFKPGGLLLAQISGRPLLPMAFAASKAWHFGWDDFVLPRPGSRIAIAIGAPVKVERSVALGHADVLEDWQRRLEQELGLLSQQAQAALA
jgi:lysophospholipid acyltransferase (LPLAT)-like uncharacterized protein